ncbi:MAG: hypothetical protein VKK63_00260 [Synechococcus sp.]|nr:hypothetical protein [Synechococcus sp.]
MNTSNGSNGSNGTNGVRKLRFDSKFAALTEAQHAEIIQWCAQEGYRKAAERIKSTFGFSTSISSLQSFARWHQRKTGQNAFQELLTFAREDAGIDDRQLRLELFAEMKRRALMSNNFDLLLAVMKEEGRDLDRVLAERRVKVMEESAEHAKETIEGIRADGGLTPDTLRRIEEAARLL